MAEKDHTNNPPRVDEMAQSSNGPSTVRFWGTFAALCLLAFISALDVSIISTSLPAIIASIGGATQFVWVANSFIIASAVLQPLGQIANLFGQRTPLMVCSCLFALGSGIGRGAHNVAMLIAGRTIQGIGAGGIYVLLDIICCDLVPLRERGNYLGLIFGGDKYPWSSPHIIAPLVLGLVGWITFHVQQHFSKHQSVPTHLFTNRTSVIGFLLTFTSSITVQSLTYFLPIYFQGVLGTTVLESGTFFLPYAIGSLFIAVAAGALLSKFGSYRVLHGVAFAIAAVAFGLLTLLSHSTSKVAWVFFQLIAAAGTGITLSVMFPATMAGLPESDVASSSAMYSFIKKFRFVWGVTMSGILLSSVVDRNLHVVTDLSIQAELSGGGAYAFASRMHALRSAADSTVWYQISAVFRQGLRAIWWPGLGISLFSLIFVSGERSLKLRQELDTEYGLEDKKNPTRLQTTNLSDTAYEETSEDRHGAPIEHRD